MKYFRLYLGLLCLLALAGTAQALPYAYIANFGTDSISVIDTNTGAVTKTIQLPSGSKPYGVAVNSQGTEVYVSNQGTNTVSVIDGATNTISATVSDSRFSGLSGIAANPAGTQAWVVSSNNGMVFVINTSTNKVLTSVQVQNNPEGIVMNGNGSRAYVVNKGSSSVSIINTASYRTGFNAAIPGYPEQIDINPAGDTLYVTYAGTSMGGFVGVVRTSDGAVTTSVPVGAFPMGVAINKAGTTIYVANAGDDTVSVVNAATNTVTSTVQLGPNGITIPYGIAVTPDGAKIYAAGSNSNNVGVIDIATGGVALIPLSDNAAPKSLGKFVSPAAVGTCAAPSWISVRATTTNGTAGVGWGMSSTGGATYVVEQSTDPNFGSVTVVYQGSSTNVQLPGMGNGTYYYRVKGTKPLLNDSSYVVGANPCVVNSSVPAPGWISVRSSSTDGKVGVGWGYSVSGSVYVLEESTDPSFSSPTVAYSGGASNVLLSGRATGTYYYRVQAAKAGWNPSPLVAGANPCLVTRIAPAPIWISIRTTGSGGNIGVGWAPSAILDASYVLEESTDSGFNSSTAVYSGSNASVQLTGKTRGTYYYRVQTVAPGYSPSSWRAGLNGSIVP